MAKRSGTRHISSRVIRSNEKKFRSKRRLDGGKRRKSRKTVKKTSKRQPKIIYVYRETIPQQPQPQPQQGILTWGDAGKLLAVNVGADVIADEI